MTILQLSDGEVTEACELRGIRTDVSAFQVRRMLGEWLELSTKRDLPMSLLVFSRAASLVGESQAQVRNAIID